MPSNIAGRFVAHQTYFSTLPISHIPCQSYHSAWGRKECHTNNQWGSSSPMSGSRLSKRELVHPCTTCIGDPTSLSVVLAAMTISLLYLLPELKRRFAPHSSKWDGQWHPKVLTPWLFQTLWAAFVVITCTQKEECTLWIQLDNAQALNFQDHIPHINIAEEKQRIKRCLN